MSDKCKHGLVDFLFCHSCYIEEHGKIESFEIWNKRVSKSKTLFESLKEDIEVDGAVPDIPNKLVEKTLSRCKKASKQAERRSVDPIILKYKYEKVWWRKLFLWLKIKWLGIKIF